MEFIGGEVPTHLKQLCALCVCVKTEVKTKRGEGAFWSLERRVNEKEEEKQDTEATEVWDAWMVILRIL